MTPRCRYAAAGRLGTPKRMALAALDVPFKPWPALRPCGAADCYKLVALSETVCPDHGGPVEEEEG